MRARFILALAVASFAAQPACAEGDELVEVSPAVVTGKAYGGDAAPSRIRFINVRDRAVRILWISYDGRSVPYAVIEPGHELVQPTYVAHRWLVVDAADNQPLGAYISTRPAARDRGAIQIALLR